MIATPPDPGQVATSLGNDVGQQLLDLVVNLLPLLVPFVLVVLVIGWVAAFFGLEARAELAAVERQQAERAAKAERRRLARIARQERATALMLEDAYAMNRRRNVRRRLTGSYSTNQDFVGLDDVGRAHR